MKRTPSRVLPQSGGARSPAPTRTRLSRGANAGIVNPLRSLTDTTPGYSRRGITEARPWMRRTSQYERRGIGRPRRQGTVRIPAKHWIGRGSAEWCQVTCIITSGLQSPAPRLRSPARAGVAARRRVCTASFWRARRPACSNVRITASADAPPTRAHIPVLALITTMHMVASTRQPFVTVGGTQSDSFPQPRCGPGNVRTAQDVRIGS